MVGLPPSSTSTGRCGIGSLTDHGFRRYWVSVQRRLAAKRIPVSDRCISDRQLQTAGQAQADLERQLAEERAASQTLRETLAALIARIPAADADP